MRRDLALLISGQICLHACMTGMRMAAPLLALRAGYSAGTVGFLLAMFALTQVFLALPAGRFTDRHGLHKPVRLAVMSASVGAVLAFAFPVLPVLCVSALMTGGAAGLAVISLQRHVGRAAGDGESLRQVFSWLSIGPAFSNFLGPFCAGLLIDSLGFRAAFALLALLPWLGWCWVRRVPELPAAPAAVGAKSHRPWDLLALPKFRRLMLVNWLLSSSWDVHTFVVPVLGHERGLSASTIGSILGAFALCAAGVRFALPWLAAHVREATVMLVAMLATALLFALYPLLQAPWTMAACSMLLGVSLGAVQPMIMSTLHQITPTHRQGEALGMRLMAINASSVLMPLLFGAAGAVAGVTWVFWSVGAMAGLGSRLAWGLRQP